MMKYILILHENMMDFTPSSSHCFQSSMPGLPLVAAYSLNPDHWPLTDSTNFESR